MSAGDGFADALGDQAARIAALADDDLAAALLERGTRVPAIDSLLAHRDEPDTFDRLVAFLSDGPRWEPTYDDD